MILVSLPKNDITLAQAALDCGVDGIKVHLNAHHRASGTVFGNFSQEKTFLDQLAKLKTRKFVMVGQEEVPSREEMNELYAMGFEGYNLYLKHAQPHLLQSSLYPILALAHGYTSNDISKIKEVPRAWIEASIVDPNDYGKPLDETDLNHYRSIVSQSGLKVVVPSQKKILPSDLPRLKATGIEGVLLGIISIGSTVESFKQTLPSYTRA